MSFLRSRTAIAPQGFGKPVRRQEDRRLLVGAGRYSDDVSLPGQAYACLVRSPHAHARIRGIEVGDALATPGVLAVLTGRDAAADGLRPIPHRPVPTNPHEVPLTSRDGSAFFIAPHPPLPADRARFVGEAVAMVVAETPAAARDGAGRVRVDWEPQAAVTATAAASAAGAPRVWDEAARNVCVDSEVGDAAAVAAAFARAAHVVRFATTINRVTGVPMEPRAAVGVYDEASGRYTLHAGSGGSQRQRADLAGVLGVPESAVRVVAHDVGGNYGTRNSFYPEFALVAWAARRLRRPVKWTCERGEALLSDYQSRDLTSDVELALDADGTFLAWRGVNTSNVGAYPISFTPLAKGVGVSTSAYHVPASSMRGRAVLSHTAPTTPYRSAGRPEVMFVIERVIDLAARRHGFDRVALRRRNLVPPSAMPYRNPLGLVYDSGDYAAAQDRAVALADWAGFEARRAEARGRGRHRGIGLANYIELNTGVPRERAEITVRPEGRIDVVLGTLSAGQGHETSFPQLIAEWFAVAPSDVRLLTGDTDVAPVGGGSHSGRSMRLGAVVMAKASDQVVDRGARIAAWLLEAAPADVELSGRRFVVKGTDRGVDLFAAAAAALRADAPEALRGPLAGVGDETMAVPSYPYGCAVCEVEVDAETGRVEIVRYTSVDDVGRAVNPMILHGQTHGGIAAGVGQALWELCHYDPDSGQLQSASFMDYVLPRADALPAFATEISEVPSTSNPLGLRGGGEGGTTPALGAVVNAIVDALAELGVEHVEMPATPERVWSAIQAARRGKGTDPMTDTIDVHTHILPRGWEDFAARHGGDRWPRLVGDPSARCQLFVGQTFNRNLGPESFDPARRLEDMDRRGIGRQVLSPAPPLFCYWAPGPAAAEWCRMVNDAIAESVARHPDRFLGAGGLPLQAPDLAVKELERVAATLRFPAVEIGASVQGRDLDDPALAPVWEAATALGVAIFVHPQAPVVAQDRVQRQNLTQVIGFPLETALCLTRLIFGGVLERWPILRWCFAHGGGAFASVVARLDHGWEVMDEAHAAIPRAPSEYARRVWVDTLTHSPRALALVLETFGRERVVLGSDYPFRLGTEDPVAELEPANLDATLRRRLLHDNAAAFLGLT